MFLWFCAHCEASFPDKVFALGLVFSFRSEAVNMALEETGVNAQETGSTNSM